MTYNALFCMIFESFRDFSRCFFNTVLLMMRASIVRTFHLNCF